MFKIFNDWGNKIKCFFKSIKDRSSEGSFFSFFKNTCIDKNVEFK